MDSVPAMSSTGLQVEKEQDLNAIAHALMDDPPGLMEVTVSGHQNETIEPAKEARNQESRSKSYITGELSVSGNHGNVDLLHDKKSPALKEIRTDSTRDNFLKAELSNDDNTQDLQLSKKRKMVDKSTCVSAKSFHQQSGGHSTGHSADLLGLKSGTNLTIDITIITKAGGNTLYFLAKWKGKEYHGILTDGEPIHLHSSTQKRNAMTSNDKDAEGGGAQSSEKTSAEKGKMRGKRGGGPRHGGLERKRNAEATESDEQLDASGMGAKVVAEDFLTSQPALKGSTYRLCELSPDKKELSCPLCCFRFETQRELNTHILVGHAFSTDSKAVLTESVATQTPSVNQVSVGCDPCCSSPESKAIVATPSPTKRDGKGGRTVCAKCKHELGQVGTSSSNNFIVVQKPSFDKSTKSGTKNGNSDKKGEGSPGAFSDISDDGAPTLEKEESFEKSTTETPEHSPVKKLSNVTQGNELVPSSIPSSVPPLELLGLSASSSNRSLTVTSLVAETGDATKDRLPSLAAEKCIAAGVNEQRKAPIQLACSSSSVSATTSGDVATVAKSPGLIATMPSTLPSSSSSSLSVIGIAQQPSQIPTAAPFPGGPPTAQFPQFASAQFPHGMPTAIGLGAPPPPQIFHPFQAASFFSGLLPQQQQFGNKFSGGTPPSSVVGNASAVLGGASHSGSGLLSIGTVGPPIVFPSGQTQNNAVNNGGGMVSPAAAGRASGNTPNLKQLTAAEQQQHKIYELQQQQQLPSSLTLPSPGQTSLLLQQIQQQHHQQNAAGGRSSVNSLSTLANPNGNGTNNGGGISPTPNLRPSSAINQRSTGPPSGGQNQGHQFPSQFMRPPAASPSSSAGAVPPNFFSAGAPPLQQHFGSPAQLMINQQQQLQQQMNHQFLRRLAFGGAVPNFTAADLNTLNIYASLLPQSNPTTPGSGSINNPNNNSTGAQLSQMAPPQPPPK